MANDVMILFGALAADVLFGEPPALLHPVVWMGKLQGALRRRAPRMPALAFLWGVGMALLGPALFGGASWWLLHVTGGLLRFVIGAYLLKSAFAWRELCAAGLRVQRSLARDDLPGARVALRGLVSRDTRALAPPLVAAAAVESIAENASDSIIAPLLFFAVGGVPAALAYRAINTLDAMIGYRGELEWLGKAAARLDDLANLLPARVTALLVALGARAGGGTFTRSLAMWRRDRRLTESPNAGHPMAAMAGALGVALEKVGAYNLGAGLRAPVAADITRAIRVMTAAAVMTIGVTLVLGGVLGGP